MIYAAYVFMEHGVYKVGAIRGGRWTLWAQDRRSLRVLMCQVHGMARPN